MDEQVVTARRQSDGTRTGVGGGPAWLGIFRQVPLLLGAICGLAICLIAGLSLTLLHGGGQSSLPSPNDTAQNICTSLLKQDYANLYGELSASQQKAGTEAQFEASQRQLDVTSGTVTQCTVGASSMTNGQATVQFTLLRSEFGTASGSATLVYEDGHWRLDAYDPQVI